MTMKLPILPCAEKLELVLSTVSHFERKFQTEGGVAHQTTFDVRNLEWLLPFHVYQNIRSTLFGFVTKHAHDRQTGGQTELLLPR